MALTANGVGSGLDINGMVTQLMAIEQRPLTLLAAKEGSYQAQLSAYGQLKSALGALQSAAKTLNSESKFTAMKASVGNTALATASASSSASAGTHRLEVLQIAQGQRLITDETTAPAVGAGTLTIQFGSYLTNNSDPDNPVTTFTPGSGGALEITLDEGDSLEDLRDAINGADVGLNAQVVDNGTAKQLVLAGTREGADQAFTLSGTGGLAGFSYDASTAATGNTLTGLETAQDAKIKLNGVSMTRTTNTITDAVDGVTLNLLKGEEGTTTTLTIANDRASAKAAIEAVVKAYNDFNTTVRGLTAYDPESKAAAILTGDATARGLQSQLRNAMGAVFGGSGGVSTLSEIGISFNRDGSLSVNSSKLDAALNNPDKNVAGFFTGKDGAEGFAGALSSRLAGYLDTGGLLDTRTQGLNGSVKALDRQRETLINRLEMVEQRYRSQFTALDALVGSMTQTSNYLQQQLANLPKISS